ncbi:MAG TPA: O-antigen ligase family protein [Acidimicrobiales bacterium]|nr:O-antigen ligase family protein [Acidimicrobiales bacterium]
MTIDGADMGIPAVRRQVSVSSLLDALPAATVVAVTLFYAVPRYGGRDPGVLPWTLAVATAALLMARPWRALQSWQLGAAAAVPAAALAVSLLSPVGWSGVDVAAAYALAAASFVTVAAYARTVGRRVALLCIVGVAGFDQLRRAFLPWWGGESPDAKMIGTFYWHNQLGIYLAAVALVGCALAVEGRGPLRAGGWALAVVAAAGVVLSTSRASMGLLLLGWLAIGLLAARSRPRSGAIARWAGLALTAAALLFLLTSSLFFPGSPASTSPIAGTVARAAGESAGSSAAYRWEFWKAAGRVVVDHPVTGSGFGGYRTAASEYLPLGMQRSPYAHNMYLQGVAEGGLLFALPLGFAAIALTVALCRRALAGTGVAAGWWSTTGPALGALVLLLHAGMDFDWVYPGLLAALAVLAGIALGSAPLAQTGSEDAEKVTAGRVLTAVLLVLALGATAGARRQQGLTSRLAAADHARLVRLAEHGGGPFADTRVHAALLAAAVPVGGARDLRMPASAVRHALSATRRRAAVDANLQMLRAQILVSLGEADQGVRLAAEVVRTQVARRPFLLASYGLLLASAGRPLQARAALLGGLTARLTPTYPARADAWRIVRALQVVSGPTDPTAACAVQLAVAAYGAAPTAIDLQPAPRVTAGTDCRSLLARPPG